MQKKSIKLCGLTAIMGVFGTFIRWIQSLTAFEADTGLSIPNATWSYVLLFFMLATAAMLIFAVRALRKESFPTDFSAALSTDKRAAKISVVLLGIIMALGGVAAFISAISGPRNVFNLITGIFAVVCAVCLITLLRSTGRDHADTRGGAAAVTIVLFLCYWLISTYKMFSSNPTIWSFAPRLLAISATILAFYYIAGYTFKKPRPLMSVFFCQLGTFLLIITFADSYSAGEQLIAFALAAAMLVFSFIILSNADKNVAEQTGDGLEK